VLKSGRLEAQSCDKKKWAVDSSGQFYVRWDCCWSIKRGYVLKVDQKHNILPKFDFGCIMADSHVNQLVLQVTASV